MWFFIQKWKQESSLNRVWEWETGSLWWLLTAAQWEFIFSRSLGCPLAGKLVLVGLVIGVAGSGISWKWEPLTYSSKKIQNIFFSYDWELRCRSKPNQFYRLKETKYLLGIWLVAVSQVEQIPSCIFNFTHKSVSSWLWVVDWGS